MPDTRPAVRPDIVVILTDQERAAPPYENAALLEWRRTALPGRHWFEQHGISFDHHYTGSLACVPSRPTLFTGQYPDVHGVTQTDGLGKDANDSAMRWLRRDEVPTLGHWMRSGGYDTHYQGKWHLSHADLDDPSTGRSLATNDDAGEIDGDAVDRYLAADRLDAYGFSGWIGPEPHGGALANSGMRRDPLTADRAIAWLDDRYARRRAGDAEAARPFLLVVSFVNPHDIVLFPIWMRSQPLEDRRGKVPDIAPPPTADEDLASKPAAQAAYRAAYGSGYAPLPVDVYDTADDEYRVLYHRLHELVDEQIDRLRRRVTDGGSTDALLMLSADHGELLGAHGGLHQKWFNLYDEATRVPFVLAGTGAMAMTPRRVADRPTSHVDVVPTLLSAASIDVGVETAKLSERFSELHPFPGVDLVNPDSGRQTVYMITRDNILEGDTGGSAAARVLGLGDDPPLQMQITVPANVAANFEAIVTVLDQRWWKLVRSFDDPATWTEPFVRHVATSGADGLTHRSEPLPDEWELYDLDDDPIEAINRWASTDASVRDRLVERLVTERERCSPARNAAWPYVTRRAG